MGLVKILNLIASIDFCAIFSFAANQIPDNLQKFDPKKAPPPTAGSLEKKKFQIQKLAYEIQTYIDKFMALYAGSTTVSSFISNNPQTQRELKNLICASYFNIRRSKRRKFFCFISRSRILSSFSSSNYK